MASNVRVTVHLRRQLYRALKVKAATMDRSVSDLVNAAVLESLREDALDLEAFDRRAKEPSRPFEKVHKAIHQEAADLNRRKKLMRLKALTGKLQLDFDWKKQEQAEVRHQASLRRRRHGHR